MDKFIKLCSQFSQLFLQMREASKDFDFRFWVSIGTLISIGFQHASCLKFSCWLFVIDCFVSEFLMQYRYFSKNRKGDELTITNQEQTYPSR